MVQPPPEPQFVVRDATAADGPACAAIYAPYVTDTAVTFETECPDGAEMAQRIAAASREHAWLVLTDQAGERGEVVGYAYARPFKERAAYRWSCEVSVYLAVGHGGRGGGRALYTALLARLAARGYRMAAAGTTLPNPASEALHAAMGFTPVGVYRRIGWKHDRWHDVAWTQRDLVSATDAAPEPLR